MASGLQSYVKFLSPRLVDKALQAFDRATTVVVSACWGGAILMMGFAVYTTMLSVSEKHKAEQAIVSEPSLPKIVNNKMDSRNADLLVERLRRLYPEIGITVGGGNIITIVASDGAKFRRWLDVLSYVDTAAPEYHWTFGSFCVGKCQGNDLMKATLTGERIMFEAPQK